MIQTWIADVTALLEKQKYLQCYNRVPEHRQKKADRLRIQADKALSVGAWTLLQKMEKEYSLQGNFIYNISHSGNCVLCSVEDGTSKSSKLGCDLEKVGEPNIKIAERFFCESEYRLIREYDEKRQREMFYRYWVLKESFMKATRMGMELGMDQFEIAFSKEDKPYLKDKPEVFPEDYYFQEYVVEGMPYRIAVCADSDAFAPEIQMVKL